MTKKTEKPDVKAPETPFVPRATPVEPREETTERSRVRAAAKRKYDSVAKLQARIEALGVSEAMGPAGEGWNMSQSPYELATFTYEMLQLDVDSALMIGTGAGTVERFWHDELGWSVKTVDIAHQVPKYDGITYITESSHTVEIDGEFDLVFIDGDHSYQGVRQDLMRFGPKARKAIAFHDVTGLTGETEVQLFWYRIAYAGAALQPGFRQVSNSDPQRAPGIGWIEVGKAQVNFDSPDENATV